MSALAITDADTRYLCECGCGQEINPLVRLADDGIARGLNHRQIALRHHVTREYVSRMLRPATRPRFIKGHSARLTVWVDAACLHCGRTFRSAGEFQAYCRASECQGERFLEHLVESGDTVLAREVREASGRCRQDDEQQRLARQRFVDELRAERLRRKKARRLAVLREKLERADLAKDRADERLLVWKHLSLDAPLLGVGHEGDDMNEGWHAFRRSHDPRIGEDTALVVEREERTELLYALIGEANAEDVLRMNESELDAIRRKLIEAGIGPGGVQESERERLRMPAAHTGRTVAKAPLIPGRKTRRQRIAHKAANANKGNSNRPKQKPRKRWTRA